MKRIIHLASKCGVKLIIPVFILGIIFNTPAFVLGKIDYNEEIKNINNDIQSKREMIKKKQEQQKAYSDALEKKQAEKATLDNQLAILDNRLAKAELDIESTAIEIDRTELEIKKVNLEIADKDEKITDEKDDIAAILNLMHKRDSVSTLEIMLLNETFAEFLNQIKYLEDINNEIKDSLDSLYKYKKQLAKEKEELNQRKEELNNLKKDLEDKKSLLEHEQGNKIFILEQTKSSEKQYQRLIQMARQEQEQAAAEIVSLEKLVRARIAKLEGKELEFNDTGFIWPVPKNVITAYFHDPDYPFRYIFEHPGIDIRAAQGSSLRAAASGYVARAKDSGKGYSYIMIVHGNGLSTVYGHVSQINIKEDEYVVQGQVIGATGGLPGTQGAGRLTTGAHLHFEVRLNGIPVNPLGYLP